MNECNRVLSGSLSCETRFALYVTGPWTADLCERLITVLTLQKDWLAPENETELKQDMANVPHSFGKFEIPRL